MIPKRAQIAMEFVIFTILGVFFVLVLVGVAVYLSNDALEGQGHYEAEDLALSLQEELILASQMEPGYHRIIDLPVMLRKGGYTITNNQVGFTITKDGISITLYTPTLNGTLNVGQNTVRTVNKTIIINQ